MNVIARFASASPRSRDPTPLEEMAYQLAIPEGRKVYALRKQTTESVFGIIKSVMGFRQFYLRDIDKVKGEWNLLTMAWKMKPMFTLQSV